MAKVVLLVDTIEGETVGVPFASLQSARDWEDRYPHTVSGRGVVRIVTRSDALTLSASPVKRGDYS